MGSGNSPVPWVITDSAGPSRWVLVYSGGPKRPAYTVDDLRHLLTIVNTAGGSVGPLCDAVILTEFRAVSGRSYMPSQNAKPATAEDWTQYLDSVVVAGGPLSRLDRAAKIASPANHKYMIDVAIMIPYPDPSMGASTMERVMRVDAYLQETMRRLRQLSLGNLNVSAFYWLNETVFDHDTAVVGGVAGLVHNLGMRFLWIPYWGAGNATRWRELGFDEAWQQPNYFIHPGVAVSRLDSAVDRAQAAGMGFEVEFDGRLFSNPQFAGRLQPYLTTLEKSPNLRARAITIYEGAGALIRLSRSKDRAHRALYEGLVAVLRTDQTP